MHKRLFKDERMGERSCPMSICQTLLNPEQLNVAKYPI